MKRLMIKMLCPLLIFLCFIGCAGKGGKTPGTDLSFSEKLAPHPGDARAFLYRNPEAQEKAYARFIIDPVQIYRGDDHGFGNLPEEDIRMMVDFIPSELARVLGEKYPIVDKPGPDTMRIKLILVGMEKTNAVMRGLTYGNPVGVAMNLGSSMAGTEGQFLGSITLAGEFEDAQTGGLISAFKGKIYPLALDFSFTPWGAAKYGVTKFAQDFREVIDRKANLKN